MTPFKTHSLMEASVDMLYRNNAPEPAPKAKLIARMHRRSDVPADVICIAGAKFRANKEPKLLKSKIDRQMLGVRKGDIVSLEVHPHSIDGFFFSILNEVLPGTQVFLGLEQKGNYSVLPDRISSGNIITEFHSFSDFFRRVPFSLETNSSLLYLSSIQVPFKPASVEA